MTIPIQNIYYLLCYAWDKLQEGEIVAVSPEDCPTTADLFARVLENGVTHLLKRGLDRDYLEEEEATSSLRGKFDVTSTIKRNLLLQNRVACVVDSLSYDVTHNQIIKATLRTLLGCRDLDRHRRDRLLRLYRRFNEVNEVPLTSQIFDRVQLHRNNAWYGFLLQVCRLLYDNLLINEATGESRFRDFLRKEQQMRYLFEKFVLNFYRREQSTFQVKSEIIDWQQVEATPEDLKYLPRMRTDISLTSDTRKIVIDTKYYADCLQSYYEHQSIHSENLYQLFAYLKNLQIIHEQPIEGVLLYPTVGTSLSLRYKIQGHSIQIVTIDLNADWQKIRHQLLGLVTSIHPSPSKL